MEIKMSEFEPLNIAHYQQPTTPLSDGAAPYMDWIEVKRLVTDKTYQREISRAVSAAEVTVCRGAKCLRTMKEGETDAFGAISKLLSKFGPETVISALQWITQAGSRNPGFLRAMIMEPLCVVLHRTPEWR